MGPDVAGEAPDDPVEDTVTAMLAAAQVQVSVQSIGQVALGGQVEEDRAVRDSATATRRAR